nr:hypothetical protein Iba_scaffold53600CG0010 [Ipomoea batatas]GMD91799.1 hypothetical protein Iba_chr14eCG2890 [Ipomoea batatas]
MATEDGLSPAKPLTASCDYPDGFSFRLYLLRGILCIEIAPRGFWVHRVRLLETAYGTSSNCRRYALLIAGLCLLGGPWNPVSEDRNWFFLRLLAICSSCAGVYF